MSCFDPEHGLSKECLEVILQTMAEAVLLIDPQGFVRFSNQAVEKLTGRVPGDIVGRQCGDLMTCACAGPTECRLFETGALDSVECRIRSTTGALIPVLKNGRVMRDAAGQVVGAVETLTDISSLKATQQRLSLLEGDSAADRGPGGIVGKSRVMQEVYELIGLSAGSNATVLITGETGTGKELVAAAIHQTSARAAGPLVKVNCAALPENLLESELFGHTRGAFTGAIKDKIGRFELADGGTLFLDEIGEISPLIQVKLLRFLQEREFERVGESSTRRADVRIVAATARDLRDMTRSGGFREDLYYRLKVFPIHLPPLRDRREDIGLLINHFIAKFNRQTGKSIKGLTQDAAMFLMDYHWPGNIRELENAVEHAFVTCRTAEIDIFDLPVEIRKAELRPAPTNSSGQVAAASPGRMRIDRQSLKQSLEKNRWNRGAVARELGIDRTTVWRMMKKWDLLE